MPNNYEKIYAGFWVRLVAYLIDMTIIGLLLGSLKTAAFFIKLTNPESFMVRPLIFKYNLVDLIILLVTIIYFVAQTYISGATIGKRLMRIKVVSSETRLPTFGEILYRETVGRLLSDLIMYVGYLMMIPDDEKRALHDRLSDTCVIYVFFENSYRSRRTVAGHGPGMFYSAFASNQGIQNTGNVPVNNGFTRNVPVNNPAGVTPANSNYAGNPPVNNPAGVTPVNNNYAGNPPMNNTFTGSEYDQRPDEVRWTTKVSEDASEKPNQSLQMTETMGNDNTDSVSESSEISDNEFNSGELPQEYYGNPTNFN